VVQDHLRIAPVFAFWGLAKLDQVLRVKAGVGVAFEPARCPRQVNEQASQNIASMGARWTLSVGGPPDVVQVLANFR